MFAGFTLNYAPIRGTVGRFLIAWFNDSVLGKLSQFVNPIIAKINPIILRFVDLLVANIGKTHNLDTCN